MLALRWIYTEVMNSRGNSLRTETGDDDTRIPQPPPCCTSFYRPINGAPTQWSPCHHRASVKALNPEQVVDGAVSAKLTIRKGDAQVASPRRPLEYWCQVEQKPRGEQEDLYVKNSLMRRRRQVDPQREHAALTAAGRYGVNGNVTDAKVWWSICRVQLQTWVPAWRFFIPSETSDTGLKANRLLAPQRGSRPEKIFKCSLHLLAPLWSWIKCERIDCELGTGFLWIFQRHFHETKWNKMKCVSETL